MNVEYDYIKLYPSANFTWLWHGWESLLHFNFLGAKPHWSDEHDGQSVWCGWIELGPLAIRYSNGLQRRAGIYDLTPWVGPYNAECPTPTN